MMPRKVLITGASGLLGRSVVAAFEKDSMFEPLGLAFSRTQGKLQKVDLTDHNQVEAVFNNFQVITKIVSFLDNSK